MNEKNILQEIEKIMLQKKYTDSTIKSYLFYIEKYLFFLKEKKLKDEKNSLQKFLKTQNKKSTQTQNLIINSLGFFYKIIKKQDFSFKYIKNKNNKIIFLTKKQFQKIIETTKNEKHRLFFSLSYGAGLRISEIVRLKVKNLIFTKNIIEIRSKQNKKNRDTILPQKLKNELFKYVSNKKLNDFVFLNPQNKQLSTRSIEKAFLEALTRSKINKKMGFQSLRHSFAKEMLKQGIGPACLQKIIGHKNIRSTQKYKTKSEIDLSSINSPL